MVSLFEGSLGETLPTVRSVNGPCGLESNIEVAAFDGKIEPSTLVLDEMKRDLSQDVRLVVDSERSGATNLRVPFLL